jgi:Ala-tRNA(Pro) deacylase
VNSNPYLKIKELLNANKIQYEEFEHEPVYTSEQAAKVRNYPIDSGAKSLLLKSRSEFLLAVLPGGKRLDSKKFKEVAGIGDFRFALPEEVKEIMGCEIGACYPFGNIIEVKTFVDKSLLANEHIIFNPGVHDKSIKIKVEDYLIVCNPNILEVD